MKIPELPVPEKYTGLYVFDFGGQVAVGYTADEVAVLLESDRFKDGKVYRIHRALPDGTVELEGVPQIRFQMEDGVLFYRRRLERARADYDELIQLARHDPPPCRVKLQLAKLEGAETVYLTAAIFPAEFTGDVAVWLNRIDCTAGDRVDGGTSAISSYDRAEHVVLEKHQLWPAESCSRPAEEVLASTHLAVQRVPA